MIRLTCTNCQTMLTIDEGFAGGVCRCLNCGTIQTVPSRLRDTGASSGMVARAAARSKPLYQKKRAEGAPSSGLDELAQATAGSGLAGSGLSSRQLRKPGTQTATGSSIQLTPKLIILLILVDLLTLGAGILIGLYLARWG